MRNILRCLGGCGSRFLSTAFWMGVFALFVFLHAPPAAHAQTLTINGSGGGSFSIGASWTLNLSGAAPSQSVTVCAIDPDGATSCTPAADLGLQPQTSASGTWMASGSFTADSVGTWREWITVGTGTSNTVIFTVTASLNLSIVDGAFRVGNNWTLTLLSNLPNKNVWICGSKNSGPQTCTPGPLLPNPGPATTNSSGRWSTSGTFSTSDVGSWKEWARVYITSTRFVESNQITFTVTACTPETNSQFCQRLGKNCGTVSGADNCGVSRTVNDCSFGAGCPAGQTCGGGGISNVCGGTSCSPLQGSVCNTNANCGGIFACNGISCIGGANCTLTGKVCSGGTCTSVCSSNQNQPCNTDANCGGVFSCDGVTCTGGVNCTALNQTCGGGGVVGACGALITPTPTPTPSAGGPPSPSPFDSEIYDLTKHNPLSGLSFLRLFCTAANWLVTIGFVLAVLMVAIAGIRMLTSQGDEARLRGGKTTLSGAIIGLLILLFAKAIILIILNFLGLPLTAMTC